MNRASCTDADNSLSRAESLYTFGGSEDLVRTVARRFLPYFSSCKHVLDLGCGRGIFLQLLKQHGIEATGVDRAQESIEACRAKGPFHLVQEDILDFLEGKAELYDGIFCSHVIEHLKYSDAIRLLELSYQALKPGGTVVVLTPNCSDLRVLSEIFWLDPTHVRFYPQALLRQMANSVGYVKIRGGSFLGSWKAIPKREIPAFLLRKALLGKYYGNQNTYMVARKAST